MSRSETQVSGGGATGPCGCMAPARRCAPGAEGGPRDLLAHRPSTCRPWARTCEHPARGTPCP
eukprot:8144854-Pyramimonas_sp.AAC.1